MLWRVVNIITLISQQAVVAEEADDHLMLDLTCAHGREFQIWYVWKEDSQVGHLASWSSILSEAEQSVSES